MFDPELTRDETITIVVQVSGKVRDAFFASVSDALVEIEGTAILPDEAR